MAKRCLLILSTVFLLLLANSCEDSLDNMATNVIGSQFVVGADSLLLHAKQQTAGSMYYANDTLMLGEFFDKDYGTVKAEVLIELLPAQDSMTIPQTILTDKGHWENLSFKEVVLELYGTRLNGLAPIQISVFQNTDTLDVEERRYTNIPVNTSRLLAEQWIDGSKDSQIISITSLNNNPLHELGKELFENSALYQDQETFRKFFKGLYFTTSGGAGLMLRLERMTEASGSNYYVELKLVYQYDTFVSSDGTVTQDGSRLEGKLSFRALSNTPRAQRIINTINPDRLTDSQFGYVSSPAGLQSKICMDLPRIHQKFEDFKAEKGSNANINLNKAVLTLKVKKNEDTTLPAPHLLLIQKDSLKVFFEEGRYVDGKSSFLGTRSGNQYFFDIARYIQQKNSDGQMSEQDTMIVVPVGYSNTNFGEKIGLSALRFHSDSIQVDIIYNQLISIE